MAVAWPVNLLTEFLACKEGKGQAKFALAFAVASIVQVAADLLVSRAGMAPRWVRRYRLVNGGLLAASAGVVFLIHWLKLQDFKRTDKSRVDTIKTQDELRKDDMTKLQEEIREVNNNPVLRQAFVELQKKTDVTIKKG